MMEGCPTCAGTSFGVWANVVGSAEIDRAGQMGLTLGDQRGHQGIVFVWCDGCHRAVEGELRDRVIRLLQREPVIRKETDDGQVPG